MSDKQLYLYRIEPTRPEMLTEGPTDEETAVMEVHYAHLKANVEAGRIFLAGPSFRPDGSGYGITLFEATDLTDAEAFAASDPAVRAGVVRAEVLQFRMSLLGDIDPRHPVTDLRSS